MQDKDWWPVKRRVSVLSSSRAVEPDSDLIKRIKSDIRKIENKIKDAKALRGRTTSAEVSAACHKAIGEHEAGIEMRYKQLADLGVDLSNKGKRER